MKTVAIRILCRTVAILLPSVCVHAADVIDFDDYETGSVKGQPSGASKRWDSNLLQTQSPVWFVVDGQGRTGASVLPPRTRPLLPTSGFGPTISGTRRPYRTTASMRKEPICYRWISACRSRR